MSEWKTVSPNIGFVIEGCVDPREPMRDEGPARFAGNPKSEPARRGL